MNTPPNESNGQVAPEVVQGLRDLCGTAAPELRVAGSERLAPSVHRVRLELGGVAWSVIARCSDAVMATRNRLLAQRWLPALQLADAAPRLLAAVAAPHRDQVWQLYEDLGDDILDESAPDAARVSAAVELIARLHTRFAGHPLIAELRLWGTDFGMSWYATNARDAIRAVEYLRSSDAAREPEETALERRLLDDLRHMLSEQEQRARGLARFGGAETLLHGDLWPKNIIVARSERSLTARLVDWDRVGVGPVSYDLSTFLSRLPAKDRGWALDCYREAVAERGWRLPEAAELEALFTTAELSRLANRVIWPAIALAIGDADREWALGELSALAEWIEQLSPILAQA